MEHLLQIVETDITEKGDHRYYYCSIYYEEARTGQ